MLDYIYIHILRRRFRGRKIFNSLLLLLLAVPSAFSAAPAGLETLALSAKGGPAGLFGGKTLPPVEAPAVAPPFYAPAPDRGGYDWSGLPAYLFTDEEPLAKPIVEAINRTRKTLDVALYNLQIDDTVAALVKAKERGVKVRVLFDSAHVYPLAGKQIQAVIASGIETRAMNGRGGTGAMHCKYALFDGALLQTGSANWSGFAETFSYENIMFAADPDIVAGYGRTFEWMWLQAKPAGQPEAAAAKPSSPPFDPTPDVNFNGTMLPDYSFSPRGGTEAAIAKAIDAARSEADVAMFTFTSKPIMEALKRASARGVRVKLMLFIDQKFPFEQEARAGRMELHYKTGRLEKGQMHNKFAVLDGKLLINGSFNWTATAENSNTENTIFTMAPEYVSPYKAQFDRLFIKTSLPR
ncbi:MAG: phospholipase D-like domain-containing protein [Elusimicrobiota bacterium]|nr:phospholipase D-like domain-containing protein [Elusimicrobiota bacterium]